MKRNDQATFTHEARRLLGPYSAEALASPASLVLVRRRLDDGSSVEDAVLTEAHHLAKSDQRVADEFFAHFLRDLTPLAHGRISEPLRRMLDTQDLLQSVCGDIWASFSELVFETPVQFRALLAQRLGWKATDKARGLLSSSRREDLRVPHVPGESPWDIASSERPEDGLVAEEERKLLESNLLRLPQADREVLTQYVSGRSTTCIAEEYGLNRDALYKRIQRAKAHARKVFGEMPT